jgi:hypothetical protein
MPNWQEAMKPEEAPAPQPARRVAANNRTKFSPVELAAQWGKAPSTIIALIRQGQLRAIDVAISRGKPRFLIDLADILAFEARREVQPPIRRQRCRRKRTEEGIQYF